MVLLPPPDTDAPIDSASPVATFSKNERSFDLIYSSVVEPSEAIFVIPSDTSLTTVRLISLDTFDFISWSLYPSSISLSYSNFDIPAFGAKETIASVATFINAFSPDVNPDAKDAAIEPKKLPCFSFASDQ